MSLQTKITAALVAVLGADKVYPQAVPEDVPSPFVVYRILNKDPLTTLDDTENDIRYIVAFESYADDYQDALTLAGQVRTALTAAGTGLVYFRDVSPGEDYVPELDGYVEPVFFGFWDT